MSEKTDKDLELCILDTEEWSLILSFLSLSLKMILPTTESSAISMLKTEAIFEALVVKAEEWNNIFPISLIGATMQDSS